jgi:hypothetical protein
MILPTMSNEQFALYIASVKYSTSRDVINIAEKYYEWLESKHNSSEYDIVAAIESKNLKMKDI